MDNMVRCWNMIPLSLTSWVASWLKHPSRMGEDLSLFLCPSCFRLPSSSPFHLVLLFTCLFLLLLLLGPAVLGRVAFGMAAARMCARWGMVSLRLTQTEDEVSWRRW